jgi:membrane-bound lytic murein transglycosylase B
MVYDQSIVNRDRGQRVFGQIFSEFSCRMASEGRRVKGQQLIQTYAQAFARAEKEYGVPPAVIAAFWALESDFGAVQGKLSTLRSLVSLAYDCRRAQMFHDETIAALKIVERSDLSPAEMIGSWAGELGQTQFLRATISTTRWTTMATATATCCAARRTSSDRRRTTSPLA